MNYLRGLQLRRSASLNAIPSKHKNKRHKDAQVSDQESDLDSGNDDTVPGMGQVPSVSEDATQS